MSLLPRLHRLPFRQGNRYFTSNNNSNVAPSFLRRFSLGVVAVSASLGLWIWSNHERTQYLGPHSFAPVQITSSEPTGPNTKLLRLKLSDLSLNNATFPSPIWSIFVKDSDIQIERPFTPLEGLSSSNEVDLWVKRYPDSEMGSWLHSKAVGDSIEVRGPDRTWAWEDGAWDNVVMIAGGTGITPFHQLLHHVFEQIKKTSTKFVLLHGYRYRDELPPESVLQKFENWAEANPDILKVQTFVEHASSNQNGSGLKVGRISEEDVREAIGESGLSPRTIVLVCGPEKMIEAFAGPRDRDGSQGPVTGVLAKLPGQFKVWKL